MTEDDLATVPQARYGRLRRRRRHSPGSDADPGSVISKGDVALATVDAAAAWPLGALVVAVFGGAVLLVARLLRGRR